MTKEKTMPETPEEAQSFADALASFRAAFPADRRRGPSADDLEDAFDRVFKEDRHG